MNLTHTTIEGKISMVDITNKDTTNRIARARGSVLLSQDAFNKVKNLEIIKGDVLTTAKIAGINAAKKTHELIPLCHQINLTHVDVNFEFKDSNSSIIINSIIKCNGKTGSEMEALSSVAVAALTIYDMCKSIDKSIIINKIELVEKSGGKSGHFIKGKND